MHGPLRIRVVWLARMIVIEQDMNGGRGGKQWGDERDHGQGHQDPSTAGHPGILLCGASDRNRSSANYLMGAGLVSTDCSGC